MRKLHYHAASNDVVTNVVIFKLDFDICNLKKVLQRKADDMAFLEIAKDLQQKIITPDQNEKVSELTEMILPISQLQASVINDRIEHDSLNRYACSCSMPDSKDELLALKLVLETGACSLFDAKRTTSSKTW